MNQTIIFLRDNNNNLLENEYEKIGLDMWQLIADNSSLLIVILLRRCSKFLSNIKTKDKERVCQELQEKCELEKTEKFCEILKKSGAIISGSFVLSCILGWEFEYNDIDIYEKKMDNMFELEKKIIKNDYGYYRKNTNLYNFLYESWSKIYNRKDENGLFDIMDFKNEKKCISIIGIKDSKLNNLLNFIRNYYDLDVCKNYFDGEKIKVMYPEKILKKEGLLSPNILLIMTYDSYYTEKNSFAYNLSFGEKIDTNLLQGKLHRNIYQGKKIKSEHRYKNSEKKDYKYYFEIKMEERRDKYMKRGFNIKLNDNIIKK